jgi:hypothetical protein
LGSARPGETIASTAASVRRGRGIRRPERAVVGMLIPVCGLPGAKSTGKVAISIGKVATGGNLARRHKPLRNKD